MEVYYAIAECKKRGDPNLHLHMKGLKELPAEIFELTHLQLLQLSNNKLSDLPEQLTLLSDLTGLSVKHNKLGHPPAPVFLKVQKKNTALHNLLLSIARCGRSLGRWIFHGTVSPSCAFPLLLNNYYRTTIIMSHS